MLLEKLATTSFLCSYKQRQACIRAGCPWERSARLTLATELDLKCRGIGVGVSHRLRLKPLIGVMWVFMAGGPATRIRPRTCRSVFRPLLACLVCASTPKVALVAIGGLLSPPANADERQPTLVNEKAVRVLIWREVCQCAESTATGLEPK